MRVVQKLLGHSKLEITEQYAHLAPDYMQGVMEALDL
jgi:site-specific recombinase XerD